MKNFENDAGKFCLINKNQLNDAHWRIRSSRYDGFVLVDVQRLGKVVIPMMNFPAVVK